MASLGHVAVGLAAARTYREGDRPHWRSAVTWSALSMLPDADVIGFSLGVPYEAPWGHRGATHSFAFTVVVGLAAGLIARLRSDRQERASAFAQSPGDALWRDRSAGQPRWFKRPALRTALFASVVLATHPLLDTLTDGGLGCALLWPFDLTRYFAPWRPIQVAPIGLAFLSPYGAIVALSEIVLFLPLFVLALRPSNFRLQTSTFTLLSLAWLAAAWLIASTDQVREAVVATLLRDRTEFAQGFSEPRFERVTEGLSRAEVRQQLGAPIEEGWMYAPEGQSPVNMSVAKATDCVAVQFENDRVKESFQPAACEARGIRVGQPKADVERALGQPSDSCWGYSKGPPRRPFRLRLVCFHGATVEMVARRWVF
jgi:inner membrane protein